MILKKITPTLTISGEVYSNSRVWGHEVKAFYNGYEVAKKRVRYYNRTWEAFQFQTAWKGLLDKLSKDNAVPVEDQVALELAIQ